MITDSTKNIVERHPYVALAFVAGLFVVAHTMDFRDAKAVDEQEPADCVVCEATTQVSSVLVLDCASEIQRPEVWVEVSPPAPGKLTRL